MSTESEHLVLFQHIEDKFNEAMVSNDVEKISNCIVDLEVGDEIAVVQLSKIRKS